MHHGSKGCLIPEKGVTGARGQALIVKNVRTRSFAHSNSVLLLSNSFPIKVVVKLHDIVHVCVLVLNAQADDQLIVAAPMAELKGIDFGAPLHSLVIAGNVHVMEEEMIDCYRVHNQPGLKPYMPPTDASDDEGEL